MSPASTQIKSSALLRRLGLWTQLALEAEDAEDTRDDEPSVGADATELDDCDLGEPRQYPPAADQAIIEEARSRYAASTGCKVVAMLASDPVGRPGAWLLHRRSGGAK